MKIYQRWIEGERFEYWQDHGVTKNPVWVGSFPDAGYGIMMFPSLVDLFEHAEKEIKLDKDLEKKFNKEPPTQDLPKEDV